MASVKFLRYLVVGRNGDIIELYIEEKIYTCICRYLIFTLH